jgi:hypothetical protein
MKCSGLWLVVHLQIEFTASPDIPRDGVSGQDRFGKGDRGADGQEWHPSAVSIR